MLNKVMLIGRLGRNPELRYIPGGQPVTTLNLATDDSYTDRDGNRVERTEWHRVNVWGKQAESCCNYLAKGSLVYIEGSLQTRKYQDQQGQDRYATDVRAQRVIFLDRKEGSRARGDAPEYEDEPGRFSPQGNSDYSERPAAKNRNAGRKNADYDESQKTSPSEESPLDDMPF